jgi:hypothetical protein
MLRLDDSIFEYALYDVLNGLAARSGEVVELDALRNGWRGTGLRHSDLHVALELLVAAESLSRPHAGAWQLTRAGAERAALVATAANPTMADQVARSVLQLVKARVPAGVRVPQAVMMRRRVAARIRVRGMMRPGQL